LRLYGIYYISVQYRTPETTLSTVGTYMDCRVINSFLGGHFTLGSSL
jgi:hypothetical protein